MEVDCSQLLRHWRGPKKMKKEETRLRRRKDDVVVVGVWQREWREGTRRCQQVT